MRKIGRFASNYLHNFVSSIITFKRIQRITFATNDPIRTWVRTFIIKPNLKKTENIWPLPFKTGNLPFLCSFPFIWIQDWVKVTITTERNFKYKIQTFFVVFLKITMLLRMFTFLYGLEGVKNSTFTLELFHSIIWLAFFTFTKACQLDMLNSERNWVSFIGNLFEQLLHLGILRTSKYFESQNV